MANDPSPINGGVQRFLRDLRRSAERRSGEDRRKSDRRVLELTVQRERRRADRRNGERRARQRRKPSTAQFSWLHTRQIQQMVARPEKGVSCPRCKSALLMGPPETHDRVTTREVHCTGCRHSVVIVVKP